MSTDPRDALAAAGAGSAAYLNEDGSDFESLADYLARRGAPAHAFRGTERVPGWCVQCGGARFIHLHPAQECRPETCGGVTYDPCVVAGGSR